MRVLYHCFGYEHRRPSKSRQAGVRGKVSLAFGKVSPRLSYPCRDPQQGTLRTRVWVQHRLIGQFGAPQARQNVPAPPMRHCGLGVYSHSAVHPTVHGLGEGPVVQHEGVLKTPLPRARAHVCRDVHIKDRVGNIVHVALGDIEGGGGGEGQSQ